MHRRQDEHSFAVTFQAAPALAEAINTGAAREDLSHSAFVRRIVAAGLREAGLLPVGVPIVGRAGRPRKAVAA